MASMHFIYTPSGVVHIDNSTNRPRFSNEIKDKAIELLPFFACHRWILGPSTLREDVTVLVAVATTSIEGGTGSGIPPPS